MQLQRGSNKIAVSFPKFSNFPRKFQTSVLRQTQPNLLDSAATSTAQSHIHVSCDCSTNPTNYYSSVIRQCTDRKSITDLTMIQTHMTKSGFVRLSLGNKLVEGYIKCGSIADARKLFDELPQKHIVVWNSMIACYIRSRRSKEAISLYERMVLERVFPDEFTFSSVFKAFSDLGLVRQGQRAHGLSVVLGVEASNEFVGSALVDMYVKFGNMRDAQLVSKQVVDKDVDLYTASIIGHKLVEGYIKCGSIGDARKLFDEMPQKHIVMWNSMIACYIGSRRSKEAISLFERMVLEGVFPDEFTFSSVFKAFLDLGLLREGQRAHGLSVVLGVEASDVFVGSALVDMYAKFGNMRDARLVSKGVVDKDVVLYTALIVGHSQCGEDGEAMEVFENMIRDGVKANEYTFASILIACGNLKDLCKGKSIHGLIVTSGFESAVASQTSLLTMYSRCGLIDDALRIFKRFVSPNQVTWTSLIVGLVQNGKEEIALTKFRQMIRGSIVPNSFTLLSIIQACSGLAMLEQGNQIHAIVVKYGLDRDKYAGGALIDFYGKCGVVDMAKSVFDGLNELDLVPINSMIFSYAQNGFGHEALALYSRMKDLCFEPNDVTLLGVLSACNNAGLLEEGCEIFASISSDNSIELTRDHYACVVDLLGRAGRLQEAETMVKEVKNPDVVIWRTLLNACRIHGDVDMAERVMNRVLEIAPADEGVHVMLSNLYASTGSWNHVMQMKSAMKKMRVKKTPAMSWVDVDREVHTFMAGDLSHPNSREICETLEELIVRAKSLGYIPDTRCVLQALDEKEKEHSLYYHSEKLAIAFALWRSRDKTTSIRILKNLRVCGDCHNWIKFISIVVGREIIARDAKRFHHFRDGVCSCGDYW